MLWRMLAGPEIATILGAVLVPVLTAVLGAVGILLRDRSKTGRRKLQMEDAGRRVALANEWWQARQSVPSSPETLQADASRVLTWLDTAAEAFGGQQAASTDLRPESLGRRLVLAYPFRRWTARLVRVGFYVDLGLMLIMLLTSMQVMVTGDAGPGRTMQDRVVWGLISAFLLGLVALGLRLWAVTIEEVAARRAAAVTA
ncbi:hypothetical protein F4553_002356 [Allocatelliglobosispora scoriae]|uniref:Uncharacterized protein n=1 Tax=Allocatelliglobosispora scoriae TaxID=643052 RepID=A0A841BIN0_9ACTN|nr:hypothetical protein [Allocatelliglobosispora scoriae]MBB5868977.1 hypothetical protein [Allocatelliglobosispora scoriae]